jgi:hypothetical protein
MAMGTVQALNVLTGTTEGVKYNATGVTTEIWSAAVTTALAATDTISGPTIPAGCYLTDLSVAVTDVDSGAGFVFGAGYTGALAAFIAAGNTTGQANGIARANVAGAIGFTAATNTTILVTVGTTPATPVAGTITICASYTASP